FLVDTGANGSMVSTRLVKALGLVAGPGRWERAEGATGTQPLPWVLIRRLRVGRIVKTDVRMPICTSPIMTHLDGILGMAGFGPVRIAVDFRHDRVAIDPSSPGMLWGFLDIHARRTPGGLLMVPAHVGGVSVEAIIDTGSPDTLGNFALRKALL
ncbi:peptidase A2A, partial [mine drainage metagenome]